MKKPIIITAALASLVLAGCSNNDMFEEAQAIKDLGTPVLFDTYTGRATRAGATGSITTEVLKKAKYGFGVTAYYTEADDYEGGIKPNWMYNEKILWNESNSAWEYAPVKYWPNGNTAADNANATGVPSSSKISFFAYAPYVGKDAGNGSLDAGETSGIVALSSSAATTHPTVTYTLAESGDQVDLLWGTAGADSYPSATGTASTPDKVSDDALAPTNINITKMTTGSAADNIPRIKFNFKHALAKVGGSNEIDPATNLPSTTNQSGLQVQLDIDANGEITGGDKPDVTKVTIKTIKIENNAGAEDYNGDGNIDNNDKLFKTGTLDLATGLWSDKKDAAKINHVITSPASSTDETTASAATIAKSLAEPASVAKTAAGFNNLVSGVQTTPLNVYENEANPLVFIPGTTPSFKITIEYVVRTKDTHLDDAYTEVTQTISHMVSFPEVALNKKYNLIMHLGLTSVKFDATVSDWDNGSKVWNDANNNGVEDEGEVTYTNKDVHLPINVQ